MSGYEIVGADTEIVGDAVDELLSGYGEVSGYGEEIIGAPQRAKVRRTTPNRLQRLALGIGVTSVAPTSSAVVTVTPQVPFKLERFISQSIGLSISDIKVGTNSQFVGAGSIPIEIFGRDAIGVGLKGDTAVPGVDIALYVGNAGASAAVLSGAYLGLAAT
jgi:hypothetical protein